VKAVAGGLIDGGREMSRGAVGRLGLGTVAEGDPARTVYSVAEKGGGGGVASEGPGWGGESGLEGSGEVLVVGGGPERADEEETLKVTVGREQKERGDGGSKPERLFFGGKIGAGQIDTSNGGVRAEEI
jgi:hypothetical protein